MKNKRKTFDREFKQKAVELSYSRGNAREVAQELGISPELLYRWRVEHKKYDKNSFPGNGKPTMTDLERENSNLKKELRDKELELEILKKAISIFSRKDGKSTSL